MWDLYEYIGMSLARGRDKPVPWETLGRASGASKQAAQQRFERRQRDGAHLEARPAGEVVQPDGAGGVAAALRAGDDPSSARGRAGERRPRSFCSAAAGAHSPSGTR